MAISTLIFIVLCVESIHSVSFTIQTANSINYIQDEFVSVTIDAYLANDWDQFGWNSPLVTTLAKGLVPTFLRYGGTNEDNTWYNITTQNNPKNLNDHIPSPLQYLNISEVLQLGNWANSVGWPLIFGLDAQIRFDNGSWDPSNSKSLMDAIANSKYVKSNFIYAFELGTVIIIHILSVYIYIYYIHYI